MKTAYKYYFIVNRQGQNQLGLFPTKEQAIVAAIQFTDIKIEKIKVFNQE